MIVYPTSHNQSQQINVVVGGSGGSGGSGSITYNHSPGTYNIKITGGGGGGIYKQEELKWEAWFAWFPVKAGGKYRWLSTVYRKLKVSVVDLNKKSVKSFHWKLTYNWIYGTEFDKLRDE